MVGSDLDMVDEWNKYLATNAVERAAFANGQEFMRPRIARLEAALRTVHGMLNTPNKSSLRAKEEARLYLESFFAESGKV